MSIFEQFDKQFDTEGLQKDVADAANGSGSRKEVPFGNYEVSVEKMELKASKSKGEPMVSIWFKIVSDCDVKGSFIFMNQVITQGFQIHNVNEILRSLVSDCDEAPVVEFRTYSQYAELLMDIHEAVAENFEYALAYSQNSKGYNTFEITEVFPLE